MGRTVVTRDQQESTIVAAARAGASTWSAGYPVAMLPEDRRRATARRFAFPLIVLLVAGGIAWWSKQREAEKSLEIRRHVAALVTAAAEGRGAALMQSIDPAASGPTLSAIRQIFASAPPRTADLDVQVIPGEPRAPESTIGAAAGGATHSAIIRRGGVELLGLRIRHDGERISVLGYWDPRE